MVQVLKVGFRYLRKAFDSDQFAVYPFESDDKDRDEIESGSWEEEDEEEESSEDEPSASGPNPAGWQNVRYYQYHYNKENHHIF